MAASIVNRLIAPRVMTSSGRVGYRRRRVF
jgi:hypothetical protein